MAIEVDLTGKVALVTGGGAGIGQGVALALARAGADVVLAEIDPARGADTVQRVEGLGRQALAMTTDVMDTQQVAAAVAAATDRFGRLDIVVNNAGGVSRRRFLDQSERSWRRHIDINLVSTLAATWHGAHAMIAAGNGGAIVNVASIEASRAAPMFAVYSACKAAMTQFTRSMAVELSEHDIRVNAIAPDHTRTPGFFGISDDLNGAEGAAAGPDGLPVRSPEELAEIARYVPLGYESHIDECGDVVAFLCSSMARYVTGATVPVDGGAWASSGWLRTEEGDWNLYGPKRTGPQRS
jgi:NAD(P)-dependent dehydrogenase (short-subunit alcohol dehydrogenase family)